MDELWKPIDGFDGYSISSEGRIRSDQFDRNLVLSQNQYGVVRVGLMKHGIQHHRGVALLVAKAFIPRTYGAFDTPINLDGDRWNNSVENLAWRPRWFARKYVQQFKFSPRTTIERPIEDIKTGLVSENSFDAAVTYGLLEEEIVRSVLLHTYVWPTYQQFNVLDN